MTLDKFFWKMWFISLALEFNFAILPLLYIPFLWDYFWGCWPRFFSLYCQRTLHSSIECLGTCNMNIFPPVNSLLGQSTCFLFHFPEQLLLGLVGEAAPPPFFHHDWYSWHLPGGVFCQKRDKNQHLLGFVPHMYFCLFDPFTNICTLFRNTVLY